MIHLSFPHVRRSSQPLRPLSSPGRSLLIRQEDTFTLCSPHSARFGIKPVSEQQHGALTALLTDYRKTPLPLAGKLYAHLKPIQADMLLAFIVGAEGNPTAMQRNYLPRFILPSALSVYQQEIPSPLPTKTQKRLSAIQAQNRIFMDKLPAGKRCSAVLMALGYTNQELIKAFDLDGRYLSAIRSKAGLPITASRQHLLENQAIIRKLEKLPGNQLPPNWKTGSSPLEQAPAEAAFEGLDAVFQHAYVLYCGLRTNTNTHISYSDMATAFNEQYETQLSPSTMRLYVNEAKTALGIEETEIERYSAATRRGFKTQVATQALEHEFTDLPDNWKPDADPIETRTARRLFKKLPASARIAFTVKCMHPDLEDKVVIRITKNTLGLDYTVDTYTSALSEARRELGIQTEAGQKRLETTALTETNQDKVEPLLPQWPEPFGYHDPVLAQKRWAGEQEEPPPETPVTLTTYERLLFQTQAALSRRAKKIVTNLAVATEMNRLYETHLEASAVAQKVSVIRQKLGFKDSPSTEKRRNVMAFNRDNNHLCRTLPANWRRAIPAGIRITTTDLDQQKVFLQQPPLSRAAFVALLETKNPAQKPNLDLLMVRVRQLCPNLPETVTSKDLSQVLSHLRDQLGFRKTRRAKKIKKTTSVRKTTLPL